MVSQTFIETIPSRNDTDLNKRREYFYGENGRKDRRGNGNSFFGKGKSRDRIDSSSIDRKEDLIIHQWWEGLGVCVYVVRQKTPGLNKFSRLMSDHIKNRLKWSKNMDHTSAMKDQGNH